MKNPLTQQNQFPITNEMSGSDDLSEDVLQGTGLLLPNYCIWVQNTFDTIYLRLHVHDVSVEFSKL